MFDFSKVIEKSKYSSFWRWVLNFSLSRAIPFNRAHHYKIVEISTNKIKVMVPYRKSNFNHIRGLHACSLATVSEFATGLLLLNSFDQKKYRLIMKRIEIDYLYQGKMDAFAEFSISEDRLKAISDNLQQEGVIELPCNVKIHDIKNNQLTSGCVYWQIKEWSKVKTKVN